MVAFLKPTPPLGLKYGWVGFETLRYGFGSYLYVPNTYVVDLYLIFSSSKSNPLKDMSNLFDMQNPL